MIDREDMMELTRRMTVKRTSFTRAAGCYLDRDGEPDGSFNVNFLNLSAAEREKQLAIAKAIPFSASNEKHLEAAGIQIPAKGRGAGRNPAASDGNA